MLDVFGLMPSESTNYQEFYGGGNTHIWEKPRGASMVRFLLIGAGGRGGYANTNQGSGGGGSGAITSWIGPAIFVPDNLRVVIGLGGNSPTAVNGGTTSIVYQLKDGTGYTLLSASGGFGVTTLVAGGNGASAMSANAFIAAGIWNSVAGQAGGAGNTSAGGTPVTASTTTFLSGGGGGSGSSAGIGGGVTPNYNFPPLPNTPNNASAKGADGYFMTSPLLVGTGGAGGTTDGVTGFTIGGNGGIGCGGGGSGEEGTAAASVNRGGDGAVFIWAW